MPINSAQISLDLFTVSAEPLNWYYQKYEQPIGAGGNLSMLS